MTVVKKQYQIKVYDSDGSNFIKTFNPDTVKQDVSFNSQINGGFGECVIDLNLPFDNFDEGSSIDYENLVKIYAVDSNNPGGRLIYTGFISDYTPYSKGTNQGVQVTLLGLISKLSRDYFKNGSSYTVSKSGLKAGALAEDIIDHFDSQVSGSFITYTGSSVESSGGDVNYEFEKKTWIQALEETLKIAESGFWWNVGADGLFTFKSKPSSATHTFTFSKDLEEVALIKSSEEVKNSVRVEYDGGSVDDSDATSISSYGKRQELISDTSIKDATTATQTAARFIADNKDPKLKATLKINSQYDIESIKVGDTCKVINVVNNPFSDNMQIVSVNYDPEYAIIELGKINRSFGEELSDFVSS